MLEVLYVLMKCVTYYEQVYIGQKCAPFSCASELRFGFILSVMKTPYPKRYLHCNARIAEDHCPATLVHHHRSIIHLQTVLSSNKNIYCLNIISIKASVHFHGALV